MTVGEVGAVVLAAGLSTRMGQPKMVLPWGKVTIIEKVVTTLREAGIEKIVVITGGAHQEVLKALNGYYVTIIFNPQYHNGEMLNSLQAGLRALPPDVRGALIVLGDQPFIQRETIETVVQAFLETSSQLVIPSFQMRRGHPWLIARQLWQEVLEIKPPETLRSFLQANHEKITYVVVDTPTIIWDIDTPEDYEKRKPRN
ncbi:MAG: nucleotidyltransferase family protein [Anaerolineales bacterium]|jgi:molybdenum cofactor cytidylyltransferase